LYRAEKALTMPSFGCQFHEEPDSAQPDDPGRAESDVASIPSEWALVSAGSDGYVVIPSEEPADVDTQTFNLVEGTATEDVSDG
jgi:hypothetical protein